MNRFKKIYSQGTLDVMEIWVDIETGVNYVFHKNGNAAGFTPLLDKVILSILVDTFFSKISLSSFRRRISLSCSLTRLRSIVISSDRLIAPAGVWEPSPISSLPALTAFIHVWMVPSGIPNSLAALAPPISLAGFTACTLYS